MEDRRSSDPGPFDPGVVTAYPSIRYADPDAALEWLQRALGFEPQEVIRDDDGAIVHAEARLGTAMVMLSGAGVGREPFRSLPAAVGHTYIGLENVEELYQRAVAAAAEIALELTETDYGSRDFTARDPEGHLWALGTYRPEAAV